MRGMFASEARKSDIIVLCFSLLNPGSLQHALRSHVLIAGSSSSKTDKDPIVFLVGTLRELRDAALLGKREAYHELVRHYVNQKLLSTEDAKAFASGQTRLVSEASIREAMLAVNATSYTEVCFLPDVGNAAKVFSAIAEKSRTLRRSTKKNVKSGVGIAHRRSRSSVSSSNGGGVVLEDSGAGNGGGSDDDSEGDVSQLVGLAEARFPDTFVMGEHAQQVSDWLEQELLTLVRPATPREGLSRSAYKLLLNSLPSGSDGVRCPAEGYHKFEWPSGDTYAGTWRNHMYDGQGVLQLVTGCSYNGGFVAGVFSGQGVFRSPDKSCYNGSWSEGKRNGRGEQLYADGSRYMGYWRDDMRHGDGVLSYVNGTIYAGGFQQDLFHGRGRYTFNTGSTYEGEWKEGKKTGQGTLHRFDGSLRKLT
jgi:hypothetical protein